MAGEGFRPRRAIAGVGLHVRDLDRRPQLASADSRVPIGSHLPSRSGDSVRHRHHHRRASRPCDQPMGRTRRVPRPAGARRPDLWPDLGVAGWALAAVYRALCESARAGLRGPAPSGWPRCERSHRALFPPAPRRPSRGGPAMVDRAAPRRTRRIRGGAGPRSPTGR